MIYSHKTNLKFKHLLLDNRFPYKGHYANDIGFKAYKKERIEWIRENIGMHNVAWSINFGFIHKRKKAYAKDISKPLYRGMDHEYVPQWCFLNLDDAFIFRMRWS